MDESKINFFPFFMALHGKFSTTELASSPWFLGQGLIM
jgi:hypothetical protein